MKNIFAKLRKKKDEIPDEEEPEPIPHKIGTVTDCVPSPTAKDKPEDEKVYITTIEIDGKEYRTAQQKYYEKGQQVVASIVGDIALINPQKTEQLQNEQGENQL